MPPTTVYRRQSMAQLYEKLSAQSDEDDMAWLAQFSPEEKSDDLYTPVAAPSPYLSSITSTSSSSPSAGPSPVDSHADDTSSSDESSSESESDAEPLSLTFDFDYTTYDQSPCIPLLFQADDLTNTTDSPYLPSVDSTVLPQPTSLSLPGYYHPAQPTLLHGYSDSPLLHPPTSPIVGSRTGCNGRNASTDHADRRDDPEEQTNAESDDDDDDDDYLPSPTFNSRKRHRATRTRAATTTVSSAPPAPPRSVATISHAAKRSRGSPSSRNAQAVPGAVSSAPRSNPWACPYCKWVQRNHRTPDLKRHIRTHTRFERPAQWICCGVPLKDAERYTLPEGAEPYNWQGKMMIGGCGREFSRRDALKRHLDNNHITCIGDLTAFATSYD